jgi:alginate O-acetyltransferase complex protein AlgI
MLFNSLDFALFLPIVFGVYWFVFKHSIKAQNTWIVLSSYFFYGYWDVRFLGLILLSTLIDYSLALVIDASEKPSKRKLWLSISLLSNLGLLAYFKYANFFIESFVESFTALGFHFESNHLNIILPVGISFYTFQTLSYTIDVYRKEINASKDFMAFTAFVSFFPQLVAGPIERASHLLPQFLKQRSFNYQQARMGMLLILWGLFKKIVIADNCAFYVDQVFQHPESFSASSLLLGVFLFSLQIYGDFSGYSDMAIGLAALFNFELNANFRTPYFSSNIQEFWKRWHISLSTWFRDYLYIPLGGSLLGTYKTYRNILIIFVVSGLWHGANTTFLLWGLTHALLYLGYMQFKNTPFTPIPKLVAQVLTFVLVSLAWIFFRSDSASEAFAYFGHLTDSSILQLPHFEWQSKLPMLCILIGLMVWMEYKSEAEQYPLLWLLNKSKIYRWSVYIALCFCIGMYAQTNETPFIYFQF